VTTCVVIPVWQSFVVWKNKYYVVCKVVGTFIKLDFAGREGFMFYASSIFNGVLHSLTSLCKSLFELPEIYMFYGNMKHWAWVAKL